jgi:hypothetical protein
MIRYNKCYLLFLYNSYVLLLWFNMIVKNLSPIYIIKLLGQCRNSENYLLK